MNYIKHLNNAFEKFYDDQRLSPFHVSLYFALFQHWNIARFRNPISVSRNEIMMASKIGSVNTYIRCMKELDTWSYIKYHPSFNPQKGSQVYMYDFDNSTDKTINNATDISNNKRIGKALKKTADKSGETPVIHSINNTNKTNKLNIKKEYEHKSKKNSVKPLLLYSRKTSGGGKKIKQKKIASKKAKTTSFSKREEQTIEVKRSSRPLLKQVKNFFTSKNWPHIEAEKFFNYFESNGWLVGGKTPMKNWKASASNWIINSERFGKKTEKLEPGKLAITNSKNYAEPL